MPPAITPPHTQNLNSTSSTMTAIVGKMSESITTDKPAELPRPYKCPLCDKAFHRLEHQTRHIRTHTGEKPHACTHPGCSKKFSRSDELTRHTRIHNNPNSRRNNKTIGHHSNAAVVASYAQEQSMMPPPRTISAPHSVIVSPNVSPPNSYTHHLVSRPDNTNPQQNHSDISMLASAANHVERDSFVVTNHCRQGSVSLIPPFASYRHNPASLSAYAYSYSTNSTANNSPSMSRSHSPSRPSITSPQSTAPSSPSYSHESLSPTPDHTPLVTPAQSPRMRPMSGLGGFHSTSSSSISHLLNETSTNSSSGIHLPALRSLSLGQSAANMHLGVSGSYPAPALAPLEPRTETSVGSANSTPYGSYISSSSSHGRLSDIMRSTDGSQRKLPIPRPPVADPDMMEQ